MQRLIAVLVAVSLLLLQLVGAHHHRHFDVGHEHGGHGSALHFADVGHHWTAAEDDHGHRHGAGATADHPHIDIETKVVADGLIKVFVDILPLGLVYAVAIMLWLAAPPPPLLRSAINPLWRGPPRYALRPPSQAPPVGFSHRF